jgi:hypothetical protein
LYSILTEFGVPKKVVRLIKMCLNKTYSKVRVAKHFLNWSKTRRYLSPLFLNFALRYCIRKVQGNQVRLKLNVAYY